MATKSFLKTISLGKKSQAQSFIRAVEKSFASNKTSGKKISTELPRELTKEQIQKIFCSDTEAKETT